MPRLTHLSLVHTLPGPHHRSDTQPMPPKYHQNSAAEKKTEKNVLFLNEMTDCTFPIISIWSHFSFLFLNICWQTVCLFCCLRKSCSTVMILVFWLGATDYKSKMCLYAVFFLFILYPCGSIYVVRNKSRAVNPQWPNVIHVYM